jgi:hypothetical protein
LAAHWLGVDERPPYRGVQQSGLLRAAFGCGPTFLQGRAVELLMPPLRRYWVRNVFSPRRETLANSRDYEVFDASVFEQGSGTWLDGWFQSEKYFAANADRVRRWFRPAPADERLLIRLAAEWPAPAERMAALHVRRGDYGNVRDILSNGEQGWLLPISYYRQALEQIPGDAELAVFSDDPDWAAREFADRRPWVSRGNSAAVDMLLMSRCRWNVTANSSFSWWAAWLNERADKVVFAPRHHLGWRIGRWVPGGIEVAGWHYLNVSG